MKLNTDEKYLKKHQNCNDFKRKLQECSVTTQADGSGKNTSTKKLPGTEEIFSHNEEKVLDLSIENANDFQWIKKFFENDYTIALSVLKLFISENLPEIAALQELSFKRDIYEIRRTAHKMIPSCRMVGQDTLAGALYELESICNPQTSFEQIEQKVNEIALSSIRAKQFLPEQYYYISKLTLK